MYIGAIDLGGTKTLTGIIDENGSILSSHTMQTDTSDCLSHLSNCYQSMLHCTQELGISIQQLEGIGITVPGLADIQKGILIKAVFSGWNQVRVADFFREASGLDRIFIENDVNACAIGELQFGYKKRYQNFLWMTVSTGVGGSVVCNGQLIRGAGGYAGEMGHVRVEYEHPYRCPCSRYGCLEAHGSGSAITRYVHELSCRDSSFLSALNEHGLSSDAAGCALLAELGNTSAQAVFQKAGTYLGRGISYYINILNPEAVILGGGVSRAFSLLESSIWNAVNQGVLHPLENIDIVTTKLGYEAAFLGAAALVLNVQNK